MGHRFTTSEDYYILKLHFNGFQPAMRTCMYNYFGLPFFTLLTRLGESGEKWDIISSTPIFFLYLFIKETIKFSVGLARRFIMVGYVKSH